MGTRNVFDVFSTPQSQTPRTQVKIPDRLWQKITTDHRSSDSNTQKLRSFDYDVDNECFTTCKLQEVRTLFFNFIGRQQNTEDRFMVVNFTSKAPSPDESASQIDKDSVVENILRSGIIVSGSKYNIVGCSNSGVQKRSFYFMRGSANECKCLLRSFIPDLDQLEQKKGVAKRTKYAGLLFTGCQYIVDLPKDFQIKVVEDVEKGKYNFTDGCGFISVKLAENIWKTNEILARKWKELPSVLQIRYYGNGYICKGVLVVDCKERNQMIITVRKSLVKVNSAKGGEVDKHLKWKLGIVATSLKPKVGKLNKQTVALLSANVNKEVLIALQSEHLEHVANARKNPTDALHCYALKNQLRLFQQLLRNHAIDMVPPAYLALPNHVESIGSEKLQIPLACSRLLLGASFPERLPQLREGQCIVLDEFGFVTGQVVVCRSPSYAPGDLQVLEAIALHRDHPVSAMRNVILFGTRGNRPDPDKMSGGDLDGDLYLVIWDERILKFSNQISNEKPEEYEAPPKLKSSGVDEDWIRYVAVWENSLLAQIDACFFQLAAERGVKSRECIKLCGLFSRAVDQHPSDLAELQKLISGCTGRKNEQSPFVTRENDIPVWDILMGKQIQLFEEIKRNRESAPTKREWDSFYRKLLTMDQFAISELLGHRSIRASSSPDLREQLSRVWQRLCKNASVVSELESITPAPSNPVLTGMCTFDCMILSCQSHHPITSEWHQKWTEKMRSEIDIFIKPFQRQLLQFRSIVVEQDKLLSKALGLFQVKCTEVTEKKQKYLKFHTDLSQHSNHIQRTDEILTSLKDQATPSGFEAFVNTLKNGLANVFLGRDRRKAQWEIEIMTQIKTQEDILLDSMSACAQFVQKADWLVELKSVSFDKILEEKESSRMLTSIKMLNAQIQDYCSALKRPDINDFVNQYQSISTKIHVSTSKIEEMKNVITEKEKLEANLSVESCKLTDEAQILTNTIDTLMSSESLCDEVDDCDISLDQLEQAKFLQLSSLESKLNQIEKRREQLLLDIGQVHSEMSQLNEKLISARAEKESLEKTLTQTYNREAHEEASKRTIDLSGQTKSFDLALCALLNEVNVRYNSFPNVNHLDRAKLNKELDSSLSRERNRCEREQSDKKLPVFSKRCDLLDSLRESDVVIVVAQTGSGKSTQVPQYLADDLHHIIDCGDKFPKIVCTQPRRVAATGITNRVALEYAGAVSVSKNDPQKRKSEPKVHNSRNASLVAYPLYASSDQRALDECDRVGSHENVVRTKVNNNKDDIKISPDDLSGTPGEVGGWVGYQIGSRGKSIEERNNSKKYCPDTRIEFVTEGLLLQKLKRQQDSTNYQCIIIDEAHERGRDTDLLLALLRMMVLKKTCNVKVVVMSASIDKRQFSNYFGGCPVLECEGKMFNVDVHYTPIPEKSASPDDTSDDDEDVDVKVSPVISHAVNVLFDTIHPSQDPGDVLIFLPGMLEIHTCVDLIRKRAEEDWQGRAPAKYVRKVVCCTNIAETSLTIPGVSFVIDAGQAKKIAYDHQLRVTTLQLQKTSQASGIQRQGRAGRVQPGTCYRLCSKEDFFEQREFDEPEMKQCPIDELYLYTLDVFGSMENLQLMPDAQPDPESLTSARERLLNLRFVETKNDDVVINDEGKLALMLTGEVSLEGVRMILSSRENGIVKEAVTLAVLLQHASDLQIRSKVASPQIGENRKKYLDELGDHFTLMKIYEAYQGYRSNKTKLVRWCEETGLCMATLKQVQKSIDSLYQTLKRNKTLGKILDYPLPWQETRYHLCKVIIAGFFHNIAELHDTEYLKAGYSMLTPSAMKPALDSEDIHLLKVHLPAQCALFMQGDVVDNTYVIFTTLYKTSFGKVRMLQTCRIQQDWIIDHASMRWQHMVGLTVEHGKLKSFVTREKIPFVGPQILAPLVKSDDRKYIKNLETETGAAVNFMFEAAEIRFYGSKCETNAVLDSSLYGDIAAKKSEFINSDPTIPFRTGKGEEPLCNVKSGLIIDQLVIPWANHVYKWSLIQNQNILFRKVPAGKSDAILSAIESLKQNCCQTELMEHWGTPEVMSTFTDKSGVGCCKVKFQAQDVARYVVDRFTKYLASQFRLGDTHCFADNEVRIRVVDTKIYPSVLDLANRFPRVLVQDQKKFFTFKLKSKKEKDIAPVTQFLEFLDQHGTFASLCLKDVDIGLPSKNYKFVSEQLRLLKERVEKKLAGCNAIAYLQLTPNPWFEVFGDDKSKFINELRQGIKALKMDVKNENFSFVYFKKHCLQRGQMAQLLQKISELRKKFPRVTFTLSCALDGDKAQPSVELLTKSVHDGKMASKELLKQISIAKPDSIEDGADKCTVCRKKITIRKGRKKKETDEGDIIVELDGDEVVSRLTLCGCIFCSSCLHFVISRQLPRRPVRCTTQGCSQLILNRDIRENLSRDMMNELHRDAVISHLTQWAASNTLNAKQEARAQGKALESGFKVVVDRCPNRNCQQILAHRFERGVYQCPSDSCHGVFCSKCGANVHNEVAFNYHFSERCLITEHFCTLL